MSITTVAAVQALLGADYGPLEDSDVYPDLQQYIDSADVIIQRVIIAAGYKGISLSTTEQEIIERWLSAHMYVMSDPTYRSRSTAGASGSFDGTTDMYLEASRYGQQAARLDFSGCLQALAGKQRGHAAMVHLGWGRCW